MGTDIYLYAEQRSCGAWRYCGELKALEIRNYEFFATLANVRNPIRSIQPFDCIVQPRGLPKDISEQLRKEFSVLAGHDPGWITLKELVEFDWEGKTNLRTAVVDPTIAHLFGDGKQRFPKDRITAVYSLAHDGPGPRVTWIDTYKEAVGAEFLDELLDTLGSLGTPEDVRIVFSFDS